MVAYISRREAAGAEYRGPPPTLGGVTAVHDELGSPSEAQTIGAGAVPGRSVLRDRHRAGDLDVALGSSFFASLTALSRRRASRARGSLEGWYRFDGGWYRYIADNGYFFTDLSQQSPVAFFPAYPLAIRAVAVVGRGTVLSAILLTMACGLGSAVLFYNWARDRFDDATARTGLLVLLLYPFAFYLFGAVYGDALFLLARPAGRVRSAERDQPGVGRPGRRGGHRHAPGGSGRSGRAGRVGSGSTRGTPAMAIAAPA